MLFLIVFFHEMGHAVCARFFSWRVKTIMLLPFGGVVEVDEHGNRPFKEDLFVTLFGPLQHIPMQLVAYLLFQMNIISVETFELFTLFNASIFLFNFIPIWPLDGGKLLFLWFSHIRPFSIAHRMVINASSAILGLMVLVIVILAPFALNLWLIIGFILYSLYFEHKQRKYAYIRFLMERYYGKKHELLSLKPLEVSEEEYVYEVLLKFQRGCKHPIIVHQNGNKKFQIDENEVLHAFFTEKRTNVRIGELAYVY